MKVFLKIVAIIYRTYDDRGAHSPYFDTVLTIVFVLFMHAIHFSLIFNVSSNYIVPWKSTDERSTQWLFATLYFCTFIILFALIFKKNVLNKIQVSEKEISRCKRILPIYLGMCLMLLLILLVKLGIEKGKINL